MSLHWSAKYVGIPWATKGSDPSQGLDCWNLIRHVYREELAIELPSYSREYQSNEHHAEVEAAVAAHRGEWREIEEGCVREFDAVLFWARKRNDSQHCGVMVSTREVLTVEGPSDSYICHLDTDPVGRLWRLRLMGFYRHPEARYA